MYIGLAMKKAIITGDSSASREILSDGENALLCRMGDGKELASAILRLRDKPSLRERIALNGYELFKQRFSSQAVGQCAKNYFLELDIGC